MGFRRKTDNLNDKPFNQNATPEQKVNNNCKNPPHFPPHCGCPAG